jgi:signal transduction histidine kinase
MTWTLRTRLTLSYVLVALLSVLLVSALANGLLESQFRRYIRDGQEKSARRVAELVAGQLRADGSWDEAGLESLGLNALEQGMIVRVTDRDGRAIWDATEHNNGLCEQMISHMARNMSSRYPNWQGGYTESPYPVRGAESDAGLVSIGYYGPFFLNDADLSFINALNTLLLWVTLAVLALAVAAGLLMARGISVPLARVVAATQKIAAGSRDVRITERTRVREIAGITTAVNELARDLKEQEALRRRLTADVAHELRTPLATLQSHLEALIDGVWQPDAKRLAGLHEETLRLARLVRDLESLARQEVEAMALDRRATDITALVRGIASNHEPQFRAKGVGIAFRAAEGRFVEPVDPDRVSQAVINLLSNALEFTPPGGSVEVSVAGREIRVSDTGIGIAAEHLPRIFDRLYRVDPSRSRATGGAGIGLAIARAIVEAHGGTIGAESRLGAGSTFTILLAGEKGA